jgi:hypothetical protein
MTTPRQLRRLYRQHMRTVNKAARAKALEPCSYCGFPRRKHSPSSWGLTWGDPILDHSFNLGWPDVYHTTTEVKAP